ncbi:MAG: sporulation protein YabP [Syntrophomonas sp.]
MAEHFIKLTNRKNMELAGVNNVINFDEQEIVLDTSMGTLFVVGEDLHINLLKLDEGKVALEGGVNSIMYKAPGIDMKSKSKNILGRLLK